MVRNKHNTPLLYVDPLGEFAQNYFHDQVVRDIMNKYKDTRKTLQSEVQVYKYVNKYIPQMRNGRVDLIDTATGEIWDVKPISYNKGYNYNKKAIPQMNRYYSSFICEDKDLPLKAGADYVFSGSFQRTVGRTVYEVIYSTNPSPDRPTPTTPDGLIIYTTKEIEKIPVKEYAEEEIKELVDAAGQVLEEGKTIIIDGWMYTLTFIGGAWKLVRVIL